MRQGGLLLPRLDRELRRVISEDSPIERDFSVQFCIAEDAHARSWGSFFIETLIVNGRLPAPYQDALPSTERVAARLRELRCPHPISPTDSWWDRRESEVSSYASCNSMAVGSGSASATTSAAAVGQACAPGPGQVRRMRSVRS
jgi:hypothetical protein